MFCSCLQRNIWASSETCLGKGRNGAVSAIDNPSVPNAAFKLGHASELLHEAELGNELHHPNIISHYGLFGRQDKQGSLQPEWLAVEQMKCSLEDVMKKRRCKLFALSCTGLSMPVLTNCYCNYHQVCHYHNHYYHGNGNIVCIVAYPPILQQ